MPTKGALIRKASGADSIHRREKHKNLVAHADRKAPMGARKTCDSRIWTLWCLFEAKYPAHRAVRFWESLLQFSLVVNYVWSISG